MADNKQAQEEQAKRLRARIAQITKKATTPAIGAEPPGEKAKSKTFREAVHERMRELDAESQV